ncbi:nucleotidyltransferase domain-containing protein [Micromonospora sp. WMMD961]|uniref:nucleotidyltransferase domain-containing protein n=1 Tax=Micromonospora sp. WMMD961 TaxID=3016100 RepID=UPI0024180297|nr:nucleotidyltransferase domain-containing protein [Micromonospora sp. WMMD961]MDG4781799.1 nucleotidyltransferase domain-containing protein [Micromonospora sp. WMMD961]
MHSELQRYLDNLVAAARDVLGADLAGAYAAGSVGLGAYQPGRSDVDVALVSAGPLPEAAKRALVARLRHEALPCPARGLELVAYGRAVAASGTPEPAFEIELNTGSAMPFRCTLDPADRPAADGRFWYGLDRSILHQSGLPLLGPPAAEVFADLAPADLRRLLVEALNWWLALPTPSDDQPAPGTEDAVLGACRSLVRHRYGVWLGKVAAGQRLVDAGDPAEVIRRAIAARHGGPPPTGAQARAFQQRVRDEIAGWAAVAPALSGPVGAPTRRRAG